MLRHEEEDAFDDREANTRSSAASRSNLATAQENNDNVRQCRICLEEEEVSGTTTAHSTLIAPCACRGTSKYVHRECLDSWRTNPDRREMFYRCGECKQDYKLRKRNQNDDLDAASDRARRRKFYVLVARDTLLVFTVIQLTIVLLGLIIWGIDTAVAPCVSPVSSCKSVQQPLNATELSCIRCPPIKNTLFPQYMASELLHTTYYVCGFLVFLAIIGIVGLANRFCCRCCVLHELRRPNERDDVFLNGGGAPGFLARPNAANVINHSSSTAPGMGNAGGPSVVVGVPVSCEPPSTCSPACEPSAPTPGTAPGAPLLSSPPHGSQPFPPERRPPHHHRNSFRSRPRRCRCRNENCCGDCTSGCMDACSNDPYFCGDCMDLCCRCCIENTTPHRHSGECCGCYCNNVECQGHSCDCAGGGSSSDDGGAVAVIIVVVALLVVAFAVVGVFYGIVLMSVLAQRIFQRHAHHLELKILAEDFEVVDLESLPVQARGNDVAPVEEYVRELMEV